MKYLNCAYNPMGLFSREHRIIEEKDGELEIHSPKLRQSLAELECEEAIIQDKERFGRARKNMMNVLRAKYSDEIANRTLNRVNKRIQKGHLSIL